MLAAPSGWVGILCKSSSGLERLLSSGFVECSTSPAQPEEDVKEPFSERRDGKMCADPK